MKRRLLKLTFSVVFGLLLLEGLCSGLAWKRYGTLDIERLIEADTGNVYVTENMRQTDMSYPHPYLAYVRRLDAQSHADWRVNNVGLIGRDFPLERDPKFFTVLVTGGSVAQMLAAASDENGNLLEQSIQKWSDKPVRVLNAANGGWVQPQQAISLLLYGRGADAVITVDGYNEKVSFSGSKLRLGRPAPIFDQINPLLEHGADTVAATVQAEKLRAFARMVPLRSVFFATSAMRRHLAQSTEASKQLDLMFRLPDDWDLERRVAYNLARYQDNVRMMHAIAKTLDMHDAYFVQPCPAIDKQLSDDEQKVVGKLDYVDTYRRLEASQLSLRSEDIDVVSLTDCFADRTDTIYSDAIHCKWIKGKGEVGHRIMAERIAAELGRLWKPEHSTSQVPKG